MNEKGLLYNGKERTSVAGIHILSSGISQEMFAIAMNFEPLCAVTFLSKSDWGEAMMEMTRLSSQYSRTSF